MTNRDTAISVRGLSKSYTIAHNTPKHTTMGEALVHTLKSLRGTRSVSKLETFWALKDVEFDIKKGDVVGIIGRNGAGKSTLLKVLSRITEPTTGQIDIYGRVGSLLEVGTGFHPELTGRENIYMNGAILGMSKQEIAKNFDAIVDFSGTEQFLDTPVKRYSSGMYVRLAFAVAAHLNPEILIVDEVLAVGDAEFQKKCLGKMHDVAQGGRTVIFVSHNMAAVRQLCHNALLMRTGRVEDFGPTSLIADKYTLFGNELSKEDIATRTDRSGTGDVRCIGLRFLDVTGNAISSVEPGEKFYFELTLDCKTTLDDVSVGVDIDAPDGTRLTTLYSGFRNQVFSVREGIVKVVCTVAGLNIRPDASTR